MSRYTAVALFFATAIAHAEPPKLAALTKTYADKHGFAVRVVKSDLGTRQVERHFVPVLPTTHEDFLATFSQGNGAVVWKTNARDKVHGAVSFGPGDVINHADRQGKTDTFAAMPHAIGAGYVTMALEPNHIAAWKGFIDTYTTPGNHPYAGPVPGSQKFQAAQQAKGEQMHGGCMWWVVHADVGGGQNLAHLMGVRRAKGPEVLSPRLVHSGNERVGPIGIPVNSIAEFTAMTDAQLMGPEPAGGAAEQVKE
ncbi:MAG: hypothetical protein ABI321_06005 [Polyangia bacterium]